MQKHKKKKKKKKKNKKKRAVSSLWLCKSEVFERGRETRSCERRKEKKKKKKENLCFWCELILRGERKSGGRGGGRVREISLSRLSLTDRQKEEKRRRRRNSQASAYMSLRSRATDEIQAKEGEKISWRRNSLAISRRKQDAQRRQQQPQGRRRRRRISFFFFFFQLSFFYDQLPLPFAFYPYCFFFVSCAFTFFFFFSLLSSSFLRFSVLSE